MNKIFYKIIKELVSEGKDYSDFKTLLTKIKDSKEKISKDDILNFVTSDFRLQQHSTPNSVAGLISFIARKNKPTNAIDICCGTGNILYFLKDSISDLTGIEISENAASLATYFIPDLHIILADTFQYPFSKKYDLVVGNIPIGMRVEYNSKHIPIEEAFVRKAVDLCNSNGEVILLVPYKVLFYSEFRKMRDEINSHLCEIIVLPTGFIRNTQVKTAVIILKKQNSDFVTISKLSDIKSLIEEYKSIEKIHISKKNLTDRWNPEFHLNKKNVIYKELEGFNTVKLKELAEILNGRNIPAKILKEKGQFLYMKPIHIQDGKFKTDKSSKYINKKDLKESDFKYILQPGDILISNVFNDLKMYVYNSNDPQAFASNNLAIIRSSERDYIFSYLQTKDGKNIFKTQAEDLRKGVTIPYITKKDIEEIRIPILPISDLNILGNNSIEKSSKNELHDYLYLLKNFKEESKLLVKESVVAYGGLTFDTNDFFFNFINDRFNKIESQLEIVTIKLDKILDLKIDFDKIRSIPKGEEEILFKLCQKIDRKLDLMYSAEKVTIEEYIEEVKRWLNLWELLDIQSQKYLPLAELLFDELSMLKETDFSLFVLQYCRSIENEILKKLFEAFHITGIKDIDTDLLIKSDLENEKTNKFARKIKDENLLYTLGEMQFIMSMIKVNGNTLKTSLLLQYFRAFTISYFDERIIEKKFLKDLETITTEYRNKAAHPYSIDIETALKCKDLLRKSLNIFLESIKYKNDKLK